MAPQDSVNRTTKRSLRIILAGVAPFVGGAEVAALRLAEGLAAAGHQVLMVLGHKNEVLERAKSANHRCQLVAMPLTDKRNPWPTLASRAKLCALFLRERPDLIHANDLPTHQAVAGVARFLGLPEICHHRFPFDGRAIDWLNKVNASRHLFISKSLMDQMTSASSHLAAASRTVILDGLPLPPDPTLVDLARIREILGLPSRKCVVLFAGQVVAIKGVADLLQAWALLQPSLREIADLVIVGEDMQTAGAYRVEMEALACELGINVRFVGFRRDVADWMAAADIVVVPSRVEPLGLVVMEAMAVARPVIGANVGGIPEMLVHGWTGLLVPPSSPSALASAISRLIADPASRELLGRQGRARCESHFSISSHVQLIEREYYQLLQSHASGRGLS